MIGKTLSHYRINARLGAGGMGEVYRASDTKLGREVALKLLPPELASSPERLKRFQREAKALAALDHPGIVGVYSVEEADGIHFLTMQLVRGQALDRAIPEGGLPLERLLELGTGLADALAAAHDSDIIHRDLKPANVMVSPEWRVKILDFGLAKVKEQTPPEATATELSIDPRTREGVVMGTVPYMSPEQVAGRDLDHRTDVFSLGVLLYEMATGRRPFEGASTAELASAILRDAPPAITELRPDLPDGLARVVRRCLEKDVRHRFQTARDVGNELREMERAQPTPGQGSVRRSAAPAVDASGEVRSREGFWVAVLPFKQRGPDPSLEALAEGLSEEIVTGLSRFSYLRVIAQSSTARYADRGLDVRAVGRELGARYVLEGSLRQAGSVLRIAAQLVDTSSGTHLWAETYNRSFRPDEIFELQDDVVPRIVSTVADMYGVLPRTMSEALRDDDLDGLGPYEAVLRSFGYNERLTEDEHAVTRSALERVVERAPNQADCWAMLSFLYAEEHKHAFNPRPDPLGRTLDAARRAVALAPSNHLAHHALAQALFFRGDLQAFRNAADRAIELNPMDGATIAFMGILIFYSGDWDHGVELTERALQLNPHHPGWYRFASYFNAYRLKDYRGALEIALKINLPSYFFTHIALAAAYGQLGEREPARQALDELLALKPDFAASASEELAVWLGPSGLVEPVIEGLRKAGLETPPSP